MRHPDFLSYLLAYLDTVGLGALLPVYLCFYPMESLLPSLKGTAYLLLSALFCTVGLYVSFAGVLKKMPAFTVKLGFNLEPIYAVIPACLFFGESKKVNASFYVGLLFVKPSVILQTYIAVRSGR